MSVRYHKVMMFIDFEREWKNNRKLLPRFYATQMCGGLEVGVGESGR